MKNVFRSVLHSIVFASVAITASSASAKQTADEFMSPDELLRELGIDPNKSIIEHTSAEMPRLEVVIDKGAGETTETSQRALVYLDGELLFRWKVSTGREQMETATKSGRKYFSATPVGTYRIHTRTLNHHSTLWDADMPFAQFFKGGVAIHATTPSHYAELGQRASGGCVRLRNTSAEKLYRLVNCLGTTETAITVVNRTPRSGIPAPLAGRALWVTQSPTFSLNCQTFDDSLIMPDGRVLQCNPTRSDLPWERRECGIKKSVARKTGQIGTPQLPDQRSGVDESNRLIPTPIVPVQPIPPMVTPVVEKRNELSTAGSYKWQMDDYMVLTYLKAAQIARQHNSETSAHNYERLALQASLAADKRQQDANIDLIKAAPVRTQQILKTDSEHTYLNYLRDRTSTLR